MFPSAKASGNMFQRKLEKLEKYLPYFFRDWTIKYIYIVLQLSHFLLQLTVTRSCAQPTTDLCVVLMATLIQRSVRYSWRSAALLEVSLRRAMGHAKVVSV